jgi:ribosomal protein S18 acetylase RimI-like enzyme
VTRTRATQVVAIRDLRPKDLDEVVRIDALQTGESKQDYWRRVFREFLQKNGSPLRVGLCAAGKKRLVGYLLGEVRAFEFGSDRCGWIFAVGVDPAHLRKSVASGLLALACRRFKEGGIRQVRTMVRRNSVPVLSFFRANGFVGGSFVELELDLDASNGGSNP